MNESSWFNHDGDDENDDENDDNDGLIIKDDQSDI